MSNLSGFWSFGLSFQKVIKFFQQVINSFTHRLKNYRKNIMAPKRIIFYNFIIKTPLCQQMIKSKKFLKNLKKSIDKPLRTKYNISARTAV